MGTRFEVVLPAENPEVLRPAGEAALAEIEEWHRRLSRFEPDSLLQHIHRAAFDAPVSVDGDMMALLEDCVAVWRNSDGAFDPSLGSGMESVALDPTARTIRFARRGVQLDFGAVGKGHALDCAARVLREAGVESALIHGGTSSVFGLGYPPGESGWKIALAGSGDPPIVVTLTDQALGASSNVGRVHVMDHRHGKSSASRTLAAVTGPSARLCDAWSTAALVMGERPARLPDEYEMFLVP
ncbi:MAG: FAD:protein FMN transferase [Gemmatimonadota bacterium]|nr:FAD:protein FMN transferase [Gemmatimonadota bacterium]